MKYILEKTGLTYLMLKIKEFFIKKPAGGTLGLVLTMGSSEPEWSSLPTMLTYKGTKLSTAELPLVSTAAIGDVWFVLDTSTEHVCVEDPDGTLGKRWEILGHSLADWALENASAMDYIKNKPAEPDHTGFFVRYNNNDLYSWVLGMSRLDILNSTRFAVHGTLPHSTNSNFNLKIITLLPNTLLDSSITLQDNTIFTFNIVLFGGKKNNSDNSLYYAEYVIDIVYNIVDVGGLPTPSWSVKGTCKDLINFNTNASLYNNLTASIDNYTETIDNITYTVSDTLNVCWKWNVNSGNFYYYITGDIIVPNNLVQTSDYVRDNFIIYYKNQATSNNSGSIIDFGNLHSTIPLSLISTFFLSVTNTSINNDTLYDIIPHQMDCDLVDLKANYTITIKNDNYQMPVINNKRFLIKNTSGSNKNFTILPDSGFTLHNMYNTSGSTCTITIPTGKCFELILTYWGSNEASWNGGLEA